MFGKSSVRDSFEVRVVSAANSQLEASQITELDRVVKNLTCARFGNRFLDKGRWKGWRWDAMFVRSYCHRTQGKVGFC
jgi:hypothetical protein